MAVVLITGCNSGLGMAGALAFARRGDTVYGTVREPGRGEALQDKAREEGLKVHIEVLDVTRPDTFPALVEKIVAESGRLDVLGNNAGILLPGAWEDLSESDIRRVMETNFFGPMLLSRAALPQMREQNSGCIIMISSLSGLAGLAASSRWKGPPRPCVTRSIAGESVSHWWNLGSTRRHCFAIHKACLQITPSTHPTAPWSRASWPKSSAGSRMRCPRSRLASYCQ